jgi:hypothetical protein
MVSFQILNFIYIYVHLFTFDAESSFYSYFGDHKFLQYKSLCIRLLPHLITQATKTLQVIHH